jgi:hypothetical protein
MIMQVVLRIANGKSNVRQVRLHADTTIGRSPDCQLKVASNQISRRHCQIVIRDLTVAIKDLGSANGTFVNGRQIPAEVEVPLTPGTRVALGPLQFSVEYDLPGSVSTYSAPDQEPHDTTLFTDELATANDSSSLDDPELAPEPEVALGTIQIAPTASPQFAESPLTETARTDVPASGFEFTPQPAPPEVPAAPMSPAPASTTVAASVALPMFAEVAPPVQPPAMLPANQPVTVAAISPQMAPNLWAPQPGFASQPEFLQSQVPQPGYPQPWDPPQGPVSGSSVTFKPGSVPPLAQFLEPPLSEATAAAQFQHYPPPAQPQVWPSYPVPYAAPMLPAAPSAQQAAQPEWVAPETSEQADEASVLEDENTFNFGIYAASGSGIIVESADPDSTTAATPKTAAADSKAGKKGLLQMLGWGKKKAAPAAAPAAGAAAANTLPGTAAIAAPEVGFVPPDLEIPEETQTEEPDVAGQAPPDDESLQSFFNQFK